MCGEMVPGNGTEGRGDEEWIGMGEEGEVNGRGS